VLITIAAALGIGETRSTGLAAELAAQAVALVGAHPLGSPTSCASACCSTP
jgi:hypothetical protein